MSTSPGDTAGVGQQGSGWLDDYAASVRGGDLYRDARPWVAQRWQAVAAGLAEAGEGDPSALQEAAGRHASDLGLTFRVTGDEEERPWPVNAMPLVIGADEWTELGRGLVQRAELLERLAADVYGPQRLVKEGHLPAAVIAGSPFFVRCLFKYFSFSCVWRGPRDLVRHSATTSPWIVPADFSSPSHILPPVRCR